MSSINREYNLPQSTDPKSDEAIIKYSSSLLDDADQNNTLDILDEMNQTATRDLSEFNCLGQKQISPYQIHVGKRGELVGLSYYTEKATDKWVINDVDMLRTYLAPSDLSTAFNNSELNNFINRLQPIYAVELSNVVTLLNGRRKENVSNWNAIEELSKEEPDMKALLNQFYDLSDLTTEEENLIDLTVLHFEYLDEALYLFNNDISDPKGAKYEPKNGVNKDVLAALVEVDPLTEADADDIQNQVETDSLTAILPFIIAASKNTGTTEPTTTASTTATEPTPPPAEESANAAQPQRAVITITEVVNTLDLDGLVDNINALLKVIESQNQHAMTTDGYALTSIDTNSREKIVSQEDKKFTLIVGSERKKYEYTKESLLELHEDLLGLLDVTNHYFGEAHLAFNKQTNEAHSGFVFYPEKGSTSDINDSKNILLKETIEELVEIYNTNPELIDTVTITGYSSATGEYVRKKGTNQKIKLYKNRDGSTNLNKYFVRNPNQSDSSQPDYMILSDEYEFVGSVPSGTNKTTWAPKRHEDIMRHLRNAGAPEGLLAKVKTEVNGGTYKPTSTIDYSVKVDNSFELSLEKDFSDIVDKDSKAGKIAAQKLFPALNAYFKNPSRDRAITVIDSISAIEYNDGNMANKVANRLYDTLLENERTIPGAAELMIGLEYAFDIEEDVNPRIIPADQDNSTGATSHRRPATPIVTRDEKDLPANTAGITISIPVGSSVVSVMGYGKSYMNKTNVSGTTVTINHGLEGFCKPGTDLEFDVELDNGQIIEVKRNYVSTGNTPPSRRTPPAGGSDTPPADPAAGSDTFSGSLEEDDGATTTPSSTRTAPTETEGTDIDSSDEDESETPSFSGSLE